ncbi:hypothetical protein EDF46_1674 [Frondihabitans sp. PhB188]|uniref:fibronectin type III domain-containing protein n=1 Tax=Frondihabitans sp. PhB188 TaxID=2485200 RepID=UPI000F48E38F|nr:fibronectin type III domain-containing protein [Frondihabitans sp. PhB188]ROQ40038.1 hypothetical protein EDF46_1674 [Frondihabitans sp. PhB188]
MVALALGLGVISLGALMAVPAPAEAAATTRIGSISLAARGPDSPLSRFFADGSGLQLNTATTSAGISMGGGSGRDRFGFSIVPPKGDYLRPGTFYARPTGTDEPDPAVPSYTVAVGSITTEADRADIIDLASDASGRITRFDVVLEGIGEFRLGQDEGTSVSIGMRHMVFPMTAPGAPIRMTQTLHNRSAVGLALGAKAFSGLSRSSFDFGKSGCPVVLAAGATCRFDVVFDPTKGGPAQATLSIPIGSKTQKVAVSGQGMLGTTRLQTTGDVAGTTVDAAAADVIWFRASGWSFIGVEPYAELGAPNRGSQLYTVQLRSDTFGTPLAVGVHNTTPFNALDRSQYGTYVSVDNRGPCSDSEEGTETVRSFAVDDRDLPTVADVEFDLACTPGAGGHRISGRFQYQARDDLTPPAAPTGLAISGSRATWKVSKSSDAVASVARLVQGNGARVGPNSGISLSAGTATSTTLPTLRTGVRYTIALFAVDRAGNVSLAAKKSLGTAAPVVRVPGAPVVLSAASGKGKVTVHFRPPASTGGSPITQYVVTTSGGRSATGTHSPIVISGLRHDASVSLSMVAYNAAGRGAQAYIGVRHPS